MNHVIDVQGLTKDYGQGRGIFDLTFQVERGEVFALYREECFDQIGLKPTAKIPLFNGALECEFRKYEIFDGKYKEFKKQEGESEEGEDSKESGFKPKEGREFRPRESREFRPREPRKPGEFRSRDDKPREFRPRDSKPREFGSREDRPRGEFKPREFRKDGDRERKPFDRERRPGGKRGVQAEKGV